MACLATFVADYLLALFDNFCFLWNSFGLFFFNKRSGLFGWNLRNLRFGFGLLLLGLFTGCRRSLNLVISNASQNVPISLRDWARSLPYLDWIFISLQREKPSVLTIPKSWPKVSNPNRISFVPKFWRSLLRILSPKSFGNPAINLYFQKSWRPSSVLRTLVRKTSLYQR